MKSKAIVVLDVGKTNKKARLYDRSYNVLAEERATFDPKILDNGLEVEDTEGLLTWFKQALEKLSADHEIRAIAITTHGATVAFLDADGRAAHPVISYTAERGAEVQEEFYATYGDRAALHRATSTPDVGFANMAKVLYFTKTRLPDTWERVAHALFYPAYLGYELTGARGMEPTYLGNHSYLWDYSAKTWSAVGKDLGAERLFPGAFKNPWDALGPVKPEIASACGLPADCQVTLGLHDSNANLLPYLAQGYENFLLNSTGTWCVLMRPADSPKLSDAEIEAKVFFNLDAFGKPVRTLIFPAGMEYDTFRAFGAGKDESDADTVRRVAAERSLFVVPGVMPDATAFPGATPRVVAGDAVHPLTELKTSGSGALADLGQEYFGALNLSLAIATRKMLQWCDVQPGTTVFIEGGFANNRPYCELLATLCPDQKFVLTNVKEGTSFGAALSAWMLADGRSLNEIGEEFTIETTPIEARDFGDLAAYIDAFGALLDA